MQTNNYEHYIWPLIYDQFNHGRHEKERAFYSRQLSGISGPILEVACGTGMILLPLLQSGRDMYGFDTAEGMLAALGQKARETGVVGIDQRISRQDMRSFHYEKLFEAVIIPARSFLHLASQEDQVACLTNIYRHIRPGGRLILNFFQPSLKHLVEKADPTSPASCPIGAFRHPETGDMIEATFRQANDIPNQLQHITWQFKIHDEVHESTMVVRWIYKEEFQLLLRLAGFAQWTLYGDFEESPFSSASPELVWVAVR